MQPEPPHAPPQQQGIGEWRYVGSRFFHPNHWSRAGFTLYAIAVPHKDGEWEAVFAKTEELAKHITTFSSQLAEAQRTEGALREALELAAYRGHKEMHSDHPDWRFCPFVFCQSIKAALSMTDGERR